MCSAPRGFVFSHKDGVNQPLQSVGCRGVLDRSRLPLPPQSAAALHQPRTGSELRVTPVSKSRWLPGSGGMLTQLPPSARSYSQMGTSLS